MDVPNQITTTMTVETVGRLDDKRGTQLINVFIPEIGVQKWSTTMFVPIDVAANMNAGDVFTATISRGKLKNNKDGEWANEYYWDYCATEVGSIAPAAPRQSSAPAVTRPTDDDRQLKIMLQHASSVAAQAYGDWYRLFNCDDLRERPAFDDYLVGIAIAATWYLDNVYVPTGYRQSVDATEPNDPWDQAVDA